MKPAHLHIGGKSKSFDNRKNLGSYLYKPDQEEIDSNYIFGQSLFRKILLVWKIDFEYLTSGFKTCFSNDKVGPDTGSVANSGGYQS
mmetsp:Transcript_27251/g.35308  ORF Transcript_27251/g.35308 Transcript_27251/m.35308 type:complete len:87 (+) Transcript_27251:308-568(+)